MKATIMDGKALAGQVRERLKDKVQLLKNEGAEPFLATIRVGDDPASKLYLSNKHKAAEDVGIKSENHYLPAEADEASLIRLIDQLNSDRRVNGILLQLPLPSHLDPRHMVEKIAPEKDVDGLTSANMGKLFYNQPALIPCTPLGVVELLHHYKIRIRGSNCVIINRSALVGKPLYHLLLAEDATVTTCHSKSVGLSKFAAEADILVTAVGKRPPFVITADMVKQGAVVIDVASNKVEGRWVGDVDFEPVSEKASYITPVPGGVGPMTVAMLLRNTVTATENQLRSRGVAAERR